ncbi:MAG: DUF2520 domain-containing protein [Proteobacteria bacterium]|nr:MAG: DUF2520 domain-containing protein [Pseudomonadota bacterium]
MFLVVGAGKLAKHLNHYLSLLELPFSSWDRSQDPHLIHKKISEASHVLLAISDGAIESFYRKYLAGLDKRVVHFSGAMNVEEVMAAHPLMSFGPELYEQSTYERIHFALSGAVTLNDALPGFPNEFSLLAPEKKALYHAMCVIGGNFPVILWQKMFEEFSKLGIAPDAAKVYLETVLANTLRDPAAALTGPLARKDLQTINKNLEALNGDAFQKIYKSFVEVTS